MGSKQIKTGESYTSA